MRGPVRMSIIAICTVLVLLTMQIGVSAKKKSSKRRHRTARSTPVVVAPPVLSPVVENDLFVNSAAPTRVAPPEPARTGGMSIATAGDSGSGGKKSKGRITIGPVIPSATLAGTLLISEYRMRGPNGANDEFVEIYNNSGAQHTVTPSSGAGYAVATSDAVVRCTIPTGTIIPAAGHFLCVNAVAFSLGTYPAGPNPASPIGTGDAPLTGDMGDQQGIALFNTTIPGNFTAPNKFDAVGPVAEPNLLYKEGAGVPTLTASNVDYVWVRDECGKGGAVNLLGPCTISTPKDTDNNASDFYFVDTNGTSIGGGQRLGAPGPQGLASPIQRNSTIGVALLDTCAAASSAPNRVRSFTPGVNASFGTLSIRRTFTNNTGANITRLRFRIIDLSTFPAASGIADLRPMTSVQVVVNVDRPPCGSGNSNVNVEGTTLEQAGVGQPSGGGFNSSMGAGTIGLATPLANGASIDVQFLLGVQQTGNFRIYVNIEALP